MISILISVIYLAARVGFVNPLGPVAAIACLSIWISVVPFLLHLRFRKSETAFSWLASESFLTLAVIASTAGAGWIAARVDILLWPFFAIAGSIAGLWLFYRQFRYGSGRRTAWFVVATALFAVWVAGIVWANGFLNPLIVENLVLHGGTPHVDTWYLASLANMLQLHGNPSLGLDGLSPLTYHYGSNWLFAQFAALANVPVLDFYVIGMPVVIVPIFLRGILTCANDLQAWRSESRTYSLYNSPLLWALLGAATIGALPPAALHSVAIWASGPILSESYTLVIPLCLLVIGTAASFRRQTVSAPGNEDQARLGAALFYLLFVPVAVGAIGIVKVSQMLLLFAVMTWLVFRLSLWKQPLAAISIVVTAIVTALVYHNVVGAGRSNGISPFAFLRILPASWWLFFPLLQLCWSWAFVTLRLRAEGARTFMDVRALVKTRRIIDVEIIVVLAIVGQLPGNIFEIPNAGAYYFTDFQRWASLTFLIGSAPLLQTLGGWAGNLRASNPRYSQINRTLLRIVAAPFVLTILFTAMAWGARLIRDNMSTRREVQRMANTLPATGVASGVRQIIKSTLHGHPIAGVEAFESSQLQPLADEKRFDHVLQGSPRFSVINALRVASGLPRSVREESVLFVQPDVSEFWGMIANAECIYSPMVGPAVAGIPMLDGIPPHCKVESYVMGHELAPASDWSIRSDAPDGLVCERARKKGFRRLMRVAPALNNQVSLRLVNCAG